MWWGVRAEALKGAVPPTLSLPHEEGGNSHCNFARTKKPSPLMGEGWVGVTKSQNFEAALSACDALRVHVQ